MKKTLKIQWMHCKSCELLVQQSIEDLDCWVHVDTISHKKWMITVDLHSEEDVLQVEQAIRDAGYQLGGDADSFLSSDKWMQKIARLCIASIILFLFFNSDVLSFLPDYGELTLGVAFVLGLVASVSTCLAVTGGIVIAYAEVVSSSHPWKIQLQFHLGRVLAFVWWGALLGFFGSLGWFNVWFSTLLNLLVGFVLFYLGLQILGIVPNISKRGFHLPGHWGQKALSLKDPKYAPLVWMLTFFLPCGFTQWMQLFAIQSSSPLQWALMMGVFALGTFPVLFSLGLWTKYIKDKLTMLNPLIAALLVVFGIITMSNAYTLAQTLVVTHEAVEDLTGLDRSSLAMEKIEVWHNGGSFVPSTIRLAKGKNYTLHVTPESDGMGCFYSLAYGGKEYFIKKWQSFDLFVDWSVAKTVPLVCGSMGMSQWMVVVE